MSASSADEAMSDVEASGVVAAERGDHPRDAAAAPAAKRARAQHASCVPDAAAIDGWFGRVGLRAHRHQVDAVRAVMRRAERAATRAAAAALLADADADVAPCRCLLQHATGSGKSLLIAALALALVRRARCALVLIVNDRLQLDQQLLSLIHI